jgi:hypothetical protein
MSVSKRARRAHRGPRSSTNGGLAGAAAVLAALSLAGAAASDRPVRAASQLRHFMANTTADRHARAGVLERVPARRETGGAAPLPRANAQRAAP